MFEFISDCWDSALETVDKTTEFVGDCLGIEDSEIKDATSVVPDDKHHQDWFAAFVK